MTKKIRIFALCGLLCPVLCGCSGIQTKSMKEDEAEVKSDQTAIATDTILIEGGKLSSRIISVDSPAKVTFINNDNKAHQIASDPHPTHSDLANLNSGILYKGESFSLTITAASEYKFHLEDNPSVGGKIIVN